MSKIVRTENLKAEDSEVEAKIEQFAKDANKEPEEYKKGVSDSQREYIANDIVVEKLFNFLKENNDLTTEEVQDEAAPAAAKEEATEAEKAE